MEMQSADYYTSQTFCRQSGRNRAQEGANPYVLSMLINQHSE
jgi:hypothetical protein